MKYVKKGIEPQELTRRRAELQATPGVGDDWYDGLDGTAKNAIRSQCLQEQGYLCAYTGLRIVETTCHLEHMWPQSQCSPAEQIDYKNLVACYNGPSDPDPGFGAKAKGDWPSHSERPLFVRPTDISCETRFTYRIDGHVVPTNAEDVSATETIRMLVLSDAENTQLVGWRKSALAPLLELKQVDELRRRIDIVKQVKNGRFEEFAFLKQKYLETKLKKLETKLYYARQGRQ